MPSCCGRTFTGNGMRNHLDNASQHTNEIECRWCWARWPSHDGRRRLKHEQREHWLSCDSCTCIFENEGALQEHKDEEHPPNYCYECQRSFMSLNNLNQHLKSSTHVGKPAKCPWCPSKFTNLTGVCLHLESGACASGINRQKIDNYCRQVDTGHVFTNKQIGWHSDDSASYSPSIATGAAWDGCWYRCYLCQKGFGTLKGLNSHLASPVHAQKSYHCPSRCRREFTALSGLINHLESESCGSWRFDRVSSGGLGFVKQLQIGM